MPPSNQPKSGVPFATPRISSLVESEVAAEVVRKIAETTVGNMPVENYYQFDHGKNWNWLLYDDDGKVREVSGEMQRKSAQISIHKQNITEQKTDLIQESISSICSAIGNQMNSSIYEKMKEDAEQCGLTFEIPPSGISIEQYFDVLSKCHFSISRIGELNWPSLFNIPPYLQEKLQLDLKNAPQEFKIKLTALLARKEAEARKIEEVRLARFDSTE
jgi:hypothetical protein